jgi:lactoylglutathione lyase
MRLTHVRLLVRDFSGCYRFYRDRLGLETKWDDNGAYADFLVGESVWLAIFPRAEMAEDLGTTALPSDAEAQDRVALVLSVESVDELVEALRGAGVPLVTEPHDRKDWGLRVAHVRDPDGNLVELYQDIEWERE